MQAQALFGLVIIPLLAWSISENRAHLGVRRGLLIVAGTIAAQFCLALILLNLPLARQAFHSVGAAVLAVQQATETGARPVFGCLAGGPALFDRAAPQHDFIIAFRLLPVILVLSALFHLLYHWGVLQAVVRALAYVLRRSTGVFGLLATVSASALFPIMIVAGTVMALCATVLEPLLSGAAGYLLAASLMNIPGDLMLAHLAVPDGFMGFDLFGSGGTGLSERSRQIMTYALCGFANLGSLGIMLGDRTTMQLQRRNEIVALAPRSVLVGFLATLLSAALIGLVTPA